MTSDENMEHADPLPLLPLEPNLDDDDDDDSFFNPMPQLQRYDGGDAPEVQTTQPVEPFPPNLLTNQGDLHRVSPEKEVYGSVSSPVSKKILKPVRRTTPSSFSKRKLKQSDTPKISKHFHKIDTKRDSNKCASDLMGVTDRLKDDTGSPNQPHMDFEGQNSKTKATEASKIVKTNEGTGLTREPKKLISPKKRSKELDCTPKRRKVAESIEHSADAASMTDAEVLSLEESSTEKVQRWLETHADSRPVDSTGCYNDTNNNTPKKAKRKLVSSALESPKKSATSTPSRKSTRHRPKKFSAIEGYDLNISKSDRGQHATKQTSTSEYDSLGSGTLSSSKSPRVKSTKVKLSKITQDTPKNPAIERKSPAKRMETSNVKNNTISSSTGDDQNTGHKMLVISPVKSKKVKVAKMTEETHKNAAIEIKSPEKRVEISNVEINAIGSSAGNDQNTGHKMLTTSPMKRKRGRSKKTYLPEFGSVTESEGESIASGKKPCKRQNAPKFTKITKVSNDETIPSGNSERKPQKVPKDIIISTKQKVQEYKKKQDIASLSSDHSECENARKPPKLPKVRKMKPKRPRTTPRKEKHGTVRETGEYTPTDDGKKRKRTFIEEISNEESQPFGIINRTKQTRLTLGDFRGFDEQIARAKGKKSGRGRGKRSIATGQQRVDVLLSRKSNMGNENDATVSGEENQSKADSISVLSDDSEEPLPKSEFKSEAKYNAYLEELSLRKALELQQKFRMEDKLRFTAFRFKGSEDEYSLRKKKSVKEGSSELAPRQRRSHRK